MTERTGDVWQARVDLAAALRLADRQGFGEGVCNHFSFMVPGRDDRFLINPHRWHWSEVTASSILLLDNDGNLLEGDQPPEQTAFFIHWRLHRSLPQIISVFSCSYSCSIFIIYFCIHNNINIINAVFFL